MLSDVRHDDRLAFAELRKREFARLDDAGIAYLDYTGSALHGASQLERYIELVQGGVFGNPHSEHAPSRASTAMLARACEATLAFFDVDAATHAVCFTANASAAIKLVAESYPFGPRRGLVLAADNHNSVNGMRVFARRAGAPVQVLALDGQLRLLQPDVHLARMGPGLLAFPAQSNFSGVRHPLALVEQAKASGHDVLLDAASFVGNARLSLRNCPADFTAISVYKMFGFPTGVGALIARRSALDKLCRPWFAGGSVDFVSVQNERHQLRPELEGFEDGTPNFLGVAGVPIGLEFLLSVGSERLARHCAELTASFLDGLNRLKHTNGAPKAMMYGPRNGEQRGATVAFNLLDADGAVLPYADIEARLGASGIAVRGGCFCNPGAAEAAFGLDGMAAQRCFDSVGAAFSLARFASCMGDTSPVGALRASFGAATSLEDVERAIAAASASSGSA